MGNLLEVQNLGVSFFNKLGETKAVRSVSFHIDSGEVYGIVGESGSGKSVTAKSILRVNPENSRVTSDKIFFDGIALSDKTEKEMERIRGRLISMVFQDSLSSLNPVYTIGSKLIETIRLHDPMPKAAAREKALSLLNAVGIAEPEACMKSYPHQLSGGMRQRVLIAMAVSGNPRLLIADEPTTALDVTIQLQILRLLRDIQRKTGMSIILITHDLGVVAQMCSRVAVMCGGHIVEEGTADEIFHRPAHPYTQALIASMPRSGRAFTQYLERDAGEGQNSALCPFLGRCRYADERCKDTLPDNRTESESHRVLCHKQEVIPWEER